MRTLVQCLIESDPAQIEAVAQLWGMDDLERRGQEAATALADRMLTLGGLERVWAELSPHERDALVALRDAGGQIPWSTFTRRWGQVRPMGPGRAAREQPWDAPTSPSERLWYRGLLFRSVVEGPTGLYEAACLPVELLERLPASPSPPPTRRAASEAEPPHIHHAGDRLLDDACTLLSYLQNHRVRTGPEGEWPTLDERRLIRQLRDSHPARLAFLRHLAQRLGWLRTDRAGHLRPAPDAAGAWLQVPATAQRTTLARGWQEDSAWNDLWHVPTLQPDSTGSWKNDPLLARQAILAHLAACRSQQWYSMTSFVSSIRETDPDFQRPDGDYTAWYIRDAASGEFLSGFASWDAVEGALIRYLLTGPLAWLGLVDLGAEREQGPSTAFRLSAAGPVFLGQEKQDAEARPELPPLVVRPDLTILAPAGRRYERFQLSRVANWVRSGDPFVYRLTPASLERARRQGIAPERVTDFLKGTAAGSVPRALETVLERWSRHGAQVRLERGILLRTEDERLMQEISSAPPTRRFIREIVDRSTALVAPSDWPQLVRRLVEQGWLPDVIGLEGEDAE